MNYDPVKRAWTEALVIVIAFGVLVGVLSSSACSALVPARTIDAIGGGAVILDAITWGKASIARDSFLTPTEMEIALRSCSIAEAIVYSARGQKPMVGE